MKTIRVAMLNVVMLEPHSPDRYVELFIAAFRQKSVVDLRGDFKGMVGAVTVDAGIVLGELYRFFDLDPDSTWFDILKRQEAEENDIARISIPSNLKPHHQSFEFTLLEKDHRLAYVAREGGETLSPHIVKKLLDGAFSNNQIKDRFGRIDVTIEPQREQLNRILKLPVLRKLRLEITPPNPDDLSGAEADVLARMGNERADRMSIELTTKDPKGLKPDVEHQTLAKIAQSNGKVVGVGRDGDGRTVELSTVDHPMVEPVQFDPKVELRSSALIRKAKQMIERIRDQ